MQPGNQGYILLGELKRFLISNLTIHQFFVEKKKIHCKCFDHKDYGDWTLRGPCRENLYYLWKRAVRIAGKPCDNYRTNNYHGVSPQFIQPFSIDSTDFSCRSPAISSPCSFYDQNICSVCMILGEPERDDRLKICNQTLF